jgi:hypothetical protein
VVDAPLSVPGPELILQLTPELDPSFATESVNVCDPPVPRLKVAGLMGLRLIGARVIVTDAILVESVLLVAVTIAVEAATGLAAV